MRGRGAPEAQRARSDRHLRYALGDGGTYMGRTTSNRHAFTSRTWTLSFAWVLSVLLLLTSCAGGLTQEPELLITAGSIELSTLQGAVISGTLQVHVSTSRKVKEVQFFLNDAQRLGQPHTIDRLAPFEMILDTTQLVDGTHTLSAFDYSGTRPKLVAEAMFSVKNSREESAPNVEPTPTYSLRGNPSFSKATLSPLALLWYDRLWAAVNHPNDYPNQEGQAASGNLYSIGRGLNEQLSALLLAFRATGDLALLDHIDRLMEIVRSKLQTQWRDSNGNYYTPTDGTAGYLRLLYLHGSTTSSSYGKDTHVMDSVMTHAVLANVAYAFKVNADLDSRYAERATFWTDYLQQHFERIWQIRTGKQDKTYWSHQVAHSWQHNIRWLYYMSLLTGDSAYRQEADAKASRAREHMLRIETPLGTARIWSHRLFDYAYGLQPITYARYDWAAAVAMHLDGFTLYDATFIQEHARTLAHFVIDNGSTDFAFDLGGMQNRTGVSESNLTATIPTRNPWDGSSLTYERQKPSRYAISSFAQLAHFDSSGEVAQISEQVYQNIESNIENPTRLHIPAGMVYYTVMLGH